MHSETLDARPDDAGGSSSVGDRQAAVSALARSSVREAPGFFGLIRATFRASRPAMLSLFFLVLIITSALAAPLIERFDPNDSNLLVFEQPPSTSHWFGTDSAGRDVWSRLIWGSRTSLFVAAVAVAISTTIGTLLGALSGFYGGPLDGILMRVTDGFIAFPDIVLVLMLASLLGPSIVNVVLVIGLLSWTGVARLVRGQFFALREQDWVVAARSVGVSNARLILRHLLPHVMSQVVIAATFGAAAATLTEAGLSYLGLGVRPPTPSWGSMLSEAQSVHVLQSVWWAWLAPGITLTFVVLSVNYVGNTLRRALDPRAQLTARR
ncbi:MAG: ABC transporter permease [Thermomicrobiales bacterium]